MALELRPVEEYASVKDVLRLVLRELRPLEVERVDTVRAYGAVCADRVVAPSDVPEVPRSHMDGFAVRASDFAESGGAPVELAVRGELGPGASRSGTLPPRHAARVATGAPLPKGADTIVPVEMASEEGGKITVVSWPGRGSFVYPMGRDIRKGEVIIESGRVVRAQDVGLLLTLGVERLVVYRRPRVAVLATGSELTNRRPRPGEIRNSHAPLFLRLVEELGCVPVDAGITKDVIPQVATKIRKALRNCDCVLTLGGTSVGKRDVVGAALSTLHPKVGFRGVRMDRGRVAGVAVVKRKPVLMMPGPVQGAMNAFLIFGVPTIGALSGRTMGLLKVRTALGAPWRARRRFPNFTKVVYVKLEDGGRTARPLAGDTESMALLSQADAFVVVPEHVRTLGKGTEVDAELLPGFSFA